MKQLTHKGQLEGWEKMVANYSPDIGLVSKYTRSSKSREQKKRVPINDLNKRFSKKKDKWPRDAWKMFDVISDSENSVQS